MYLPEGGEKGYAAAKLSPKGQDAGSHALVRACVRAELGAWTCLCSSLEESRSEQCLLAPANARVHGRELGLISGGAVLAGAFSLRRADPG